MTKDVSTALNIAKMPSAIEKAENNYSITSYIPEINRIEVSLNSYGGVPSEGLLLAEFFRRGGISTRLEENATCSSACAYAFMGESDNSTGISRPDRSMHASSILSFHRPFTNYTMRALREDATWYAKCPPHIRAEAKQGKVNLDFSKCEFTYENALNAMLQQLYDKGARRIAELLQRYKFIALNPTSIEKMMSVGFDDFFSIDTISHSLMFDIDVYDGREIRGDRLDKYIANQIPQQSLRKICTSEFLRTHFYRNDVLSPQGRPFIEHSEDFKFVSEGLDLYEASPDDLFSYFANNQFRGKTLKTPPPYFHESISKIKESIYEPFDLVGIAKLVDNNRWSKISDDDFSEIGDYNRYAIIYRLGFGRITDCYIVLFSAKASEHGCEIKNGKKTCLGEKYDVVLDMFVGIPSLEMRQWLSSASRMNKARLTLPRFFREVAATYGMRQVTRIMTMPIGYSIGKKINNVLFLVVSKWKIQQP